MKAQSTNSLVLLCLGQSGSGGGGGLVADSGLCCGYSTDCRLSLFDFWEDKGCSTVCVFGD